MNSLILSKKDQFDLSWSKVQKDSFRTEKFRIWKQSIIEDEDTSQIKYDDENYKLTQGNHKSIQKLRFGEPV